MKNFLYSLMCITIVSISAEAQKAAITDIPAEGETTISISKGTKATTGTSEYELTEGTADISGDPEIMVKAARSSWKAACADWKKEKKEMNQDNKVLSLDCNSPVCSKNESSETVCTSKATYKIKVKK